MIADEKGPSDGFYRRDNVPLKRDCLPLLGAVPSSRVHAQELTASATEHRGTHPGARQPIGSHREWSDRGHCVEPCTGTMRDRSRGFAPKLGAGESALLVASRHARDAAAAGARCRSDAERARRGAARARAAIARADTHPLASPRFREAAAVGAPASTPPTP